MEVLILYLDGIKIAIRRVVIAKIPTAEEIAKKRGKKVDELV